MTTSTDVFEFLQTCPHGACTADIATHVGLTIRHLRHHLHVMQQAGLITSRSIGEGNAKRMTWGLHGQKLKEPQHVAGRHPLGENDLDAIDRENLAWPQRGHVPAGSWRVDHSLPVRSVFDMGGA